jgi:diguanylate cyclase (GGDEF)-like protein/PAS domain S-box-containing protein
VVVLDRDHRIVSINPAGAALRGSPACQLTGRSAAILLRPEDGQAIERVLKQTESGLEQWQGEMRFMRQDGLSYPTWVDVLTLKHADEQLSNFILQFTDITDRKQTEDRLRHQSLHDILTGLPNRRLFRDHLDRAISLCQQGPFKVGVLFLDLDGFKHVNDAFGHDNGDELLRQVAGRLRGVLRATDTLARFGGDEFAAVLPGVREVGNLEAVARTVIDAVRPPYHLEGGTCEISVSAGISVYPDDAGDVETLMKYADMAMYRVKAGGKNTYRFFTPDLDIEATKRMTLIGRMQEALERGEFVVHYQPQVDIASRRIVGVEALVRWNDPVDGLVAPAAFIGLAEETGFIDALGGFVLEVACRQIAAWARDGIDGISLSVNLSARQFCASSLATTIRRAIEKSGIDPARLVLEVTETTVIEDMATAQRILDHLLGLGVRFALDDFGTGYASLAFLKRLAFSQLKIDRQFVNDLETDPRDVAIATAIIRMAGALGMEVVAEGVETDGQLRLLEGLSCDQAQGYLFARPMAAAQCRDMLLAARRCESLLEAASAL